LSISNLAHEFDRGGGYLERRWKFMGRLFFCEEAIKGAKISKVDFDRKERGPEAENDFVVVKWNREQDGGSKTNVRIANKDVLGLTGEAPVREIGCFSRQ
jgi:hypothetical protein